ncbi:MAG TPA: DJ-1/PfpI family protein [Candidatus Binatia bacterium]|nr:DJ-1/PfpI family protein [Candidatus Binatia bacterium]
MKDFASLVHSLALCLCLLLGVSPASAGAAHAKHYVCPPCGAPCDTLVFDKPGVCPQCGMALVDQGSVHADTSLRTKVAILIFNGVEIIDYTGPYEMFGDAGYDVYTVAQTEQPITTAMGMTVVPKHTFADAPRPDVLVVPGGGVKPARDSAPTLRWIREVSARAKYTMSVCNGSFILGSAGLLDGLTATTTWSNIDRMRSAFPKTRVVENQRFVDNGKIITTGGLSAGIDGALHVISKLESPGKAEEVALEEEYNWRPHDTYARAALADRQIPDVNLDGHGGWQMVRTEGDTNRWEMVFHWTADRSVADVMDYIGSSFETGGKWTPVQTGAASSTAGATERHWKFRGRDGKPWTGALKFEALAGAHNRYTATLTVERAG